MYCFYVVKTLSFRKEGSLWLKRPQIPSPHICDHLNKWKFLDTTLDPATKYFKYMYF